MLSAFYKNIIENNLFKCDDKIVIATSGGIDSVVLLHLFLGLKKEYKEFLSLQIAIAHCNFKLRGEESDSEEIFVRSLGQQHGITLFVKELNTADTVHKEKVSTQMAARTLRYEWFESLILEHGYDYIAVGHHQNDSVETVLLNLTRGTGIAGLHGISQKKGNIIRPLLFTTRENILNYAKELKIEYKEDSSNSSTKYLRNKIRHNVIPSLKEINPNLEETFANTISRLKDVEFLFNQSVEKIRKEVIIEDKKETRLILNKIIDNPAISTILFELLSSFNFNSGTVSDIVKSIRENKSGNQFFSATHKLLTNRNELIIIKENTSTKNNETYSLAPLKETHMGEGFFTVSEPFLVTEKFNTTNSFIATLDTDKLSFPLTIRKWKSGDVFHPLGMNKKKKLSDFFIDKKLSLTEKERTWVVLSRDEIIWIAGHRIDDRFRVTENTRFVSIIEYISKSYPMA